MQPNVEARIQELLSDPAHAIDRVGAAAQSGEAVLRILDESGTSTRRLMEINQELLPLIARLKVPGKAGRWWRWFTGHDFEHEVTFGAACRRIESLAAEGVREGGVLSGLHASLQAERHALGVQFALLETDVGAGKALLGSDPCGRAFAKAVGEDGVQRFARKLSNLEAVLTAMQLTLSQYSVAARHAKEMLDRFDEVRTILMPLWYQRVGFELFSQCVLD